MDKVRDNENKTGSSARVLIPVDFSQKGSLALKVGFELARRLGREATLIHASVVPDPTSMPEFPDTFNGIDNEEVEIEEVEMDREIHEIDSRSMDNLKKKIEKLQEAGTFPAIKFNTVLAPGMPEEVIAEYCAMTPPSVVVMATRGREKRHEELIGSVTAEVIDHCVAPVLTVPEDYTFSGFKEIERICAFCYFDDSCLEAVRKLMEMFGRPEVRIYLFPATDKLKGEERQKALEVIRGKLMAQFPNSEFIIDTDAAGKNLREEAENLFVKKDIQMILAPNRHRNALARFFNPGLPHKILYEIDFPMLAIPV